MIVVTGASGFVGCAVCDALRSRAIAVVTIGRGAAADIRWPDAGAEFDDAAKKSLRGARAVVHLAGENIGARWTGARRRAIRQSRAGLTGVLARAMASMEARPAALLSASAVGIYGDRGDGWLDETAPPAGDFLATVARDWEAATEPAATAGVRVVRMRSGVVFGSGGMVGRVRLPFQIGAGARLGSGRQWMSWIALDDVVAFVLRAIDDEAFRGPVNLSSPEPITNSEFTRLLGRILGRPAVLAAPAFALRLAFGEMADGVLLASQRVRPAQLQKNGFGFEYPDAERALRAALNR